MFPVGLCEWTITVVYYFNSCLRTNMFKNVIRTVEAELKFSKYLRTFSLDSPKTRRFYKIMRNNENVTPEDFSKVVVKLKVFQKNTLPGHRGSLPQIKTDSFKNTFSIYPGNKLFFSTILTHRFEW